MIEMILENIQGVAVFAVFLGILISVHEWGHFITAKLCGVQVNEFAIGFGHTLFSKFYNGTNYLIKLFPLGGYVKMAGDERAKCTGKPDEFFSRPAGQRALIVINGPLVNFVLAYVCLYVVFLFGYPEIAPRVGELLKDYPGQEAGLLSGDRIVGVNGRAVDSWSDLQKLVGESTEAKMALTVERDGRVIDKTLVPRVEESTNLFGERVRRRLIGVVPSEEMIYLRFGPLASAGKAGEKLWYFTSLTYRALFKMVTGSMSARDGVGGPVFIFMIVKNAAEAGLTHFIFLLGVISLNLAIFNLLPVIPLDGGHLLLFGIEKLRGKPLPEKVDTCISNVGVSLIIMLALFIFYIDFERIGVFEKIKQIFS
jgi:regulator of sigma E protease